MSPEEFVAAMERAVLNPATEGTVRQLASPSGRAPSKRALKLHDWYANLDDESKAMVAEVARIRRSLRDVRVPVSTRWSSASR
jgi:hypothetical protein